ncbi:hypothetical protein ACH5RR_032189 [Cinchona calisaya]|uniref:Retrotransposon gag domain-containing protein n=1 Tax=Cinchona calisaya TaxID=153742 RepID=A0ABD2YLS4_9GENT
MRPIGVSEEHIKLKAFPFSLKNKAKDWLFDLSLDSITTWEQMNRLFLAKYFSASRTANIHKEICGIRQFNEESLYGYWEHFKKLCASCPHHQVSDSLSIQHFYERLLPNERNMVDTASGGALDNLTIDAARELISNMAARSQKFGT